MVEWLMDVAADPVTAWWVLAVAGGIGMVEIVRTSRETLWGDFFADELDE
ncbi:MAG: hypothetical protein AAFW65_06240 [Pseudomonadota bacterium]